MRRASYRTVAFVITAAAALGLVSLPAFSAAQPAPSTGANTTFVLRWTGHGWTTLPGLSRSGAVNGLFAVSAPTATDIWAAGGGYKTVVEHLCPPSG